MKNNFWSKPSTTADSGLDMVSLFDYLGHAAGKELGKRIAGVAARHNISTSTRHVSTKKYTGLVMLYPKNFLDWYFKDETDDTSFYTNDDKLPF